MQVSRKDGFKISTVNTVIRRLMENDNMFFDANISPQIWERRWYNDRDNRSLYYMKGDAVWINTEPVDAFVQNHQADILAYALGYSGTRYKVASLSAAEDYAGLFQLYRDMAVGMDGYDSIYYLGNLLDRVQVKVSKVDYNDKEPYLTAYWEDFFDRNYTRQYYADRIMEEASAQISATYDKHLREYHLSGMDELDAFYAKYLQKDLTNLSFFQRFLNHAWYQESMSGFDYAVSFGLERLECGQCRWFRVWKSGLLEHGGTVDVTRVDMGSNDLDRRLYTVNLAWQYHNAPAPVYDYPAAGVGGFYSQDSHIFTGSGTAAQYRKSYSALGSERRYVLDISLALDGPCAFNSADGIRPYQPVKCSRFTRYPAKDVTQMNNDSFTFVYSPGIALYSYYARGFTVNKVKAY